MSVEARAFLSPTLVLLALDWPAGAGRDDFLGFAIRRTPGFLAADGMSRPPSSWLPNRLTFRGPVAQGQPDADSCDAPIQKFMWWDARIDPPDREQPFTYEVFPVVGTPDSHRLLEAEKATVPVRLPAHVEDGVGTWFNRAVVSSQAFSNKLKAMGIDPHTAPPPDKDRALRTWLANDLEQAVPFALQDAIAAAGAVYHLTDALWIIPALRKFSAGTPHNTALVYDAHLTKAKNKPPRPSPNQPVVDELGGQIDFFPRDKTNIMHNKVLVTGAAAPARVLMGSANFTTEGITQQANVLHTFDSPPLAALYSAQMQAISTNPALSATAKLAKGWSAPIRINGDTEVRAIFSPEPAARTTQIDTIVQAVNNARHSVVFCMFSPTNDELLEACFQAGDRGLAMFGLVNRIDEKAEQKQGAAGSGGKAPTSAQLASLNLYHRSRDKKDVVEADYFNSATVPAGFTPEVLLYPGDKYPPYPPVIIHHKFLVIDAEGDNPIVYTGSANMSDNSEHHNDENLLEIKSPRIAAIYLAEGLRLYEHYRARALHIQSTLDPQKKAVLQLAPTHAWAAKYYKRGTPECKARVSFASRTGN